jgi:hypothetical protein
MDAEKISPIEKEQAWIEKYRAALEMKPDDEPGANAVRAGLERTRQNLSYYARFVLYKMANATRSVRHKLSTKTALLQTQVDLRQRLQRMEGAVLRKVPQSQAPLQGPATEKAS